MKRTKKTGKRALEAKADKLWSQYIRLRDKDTCRICKRPGNQPHHIWGRRYKHMRHDPDNGICLCISHHTWGKESAHESPRNFDKLLIREIGQEAFDRLEIKANLVQKPDYNMAILALEELIKERI